MNNFSFSDQATSKMWNILCCIILQLGILSVHSLNSDEYLRTVLNNHFSTKRFSYEARVKTRDYIVKTFKDFGLDTWTQEFPYKIPSEPAVNIIGRVKGWYTGTNKDEILVVGTHYDGYETTPGVDDNGSGMAALLQVIAKYNSPNNVKCNQNYTLLFVAFDLEEQGLIGSEYFVKNLTRQLNGTGVAVQGAFILESIMNYNTTENSQTFPPEIQPFLSKEYKIVEKNKFRGDFLAVIGRNTDDAELMKQFVSSFDQERFKVMKIPLPFNGKPSALSRPEQSQIANMLRSDHAPFWNSPNSWPAVQLTDTTEYRGFMRTCYHQMCDNMDHVTPDMITFMGKTADAVEKAAHAMTGRVCPKEQYCSSNTRITSNKVTISSPSLPSKYPNGASCSWVRESEYPQVLEFTEFDLEDSKNCTNDYVELIAGGQSKGRYCGSSKPKSFQTSEKSLTLRFVSDAFVNKKGFKATWLTKAPVGKTVQSGGSLYLIMVALVSAVFSSSAV